MTNAWKTFGITMTTLIIITSIILTFSYLSRECNTNLDCKETEYCAYNHKCIPYTPTSPSQNLISSIIIGISIIIAALILKNNITIHKKIKNN